MAEPSRAFPSSAHQHILPGARNPVIVHPVFNNVGGNFNQNLYSISSNPLWEAIADVGASHTSEIHVERGRCLPGTRESVLKILREWNRSGTDSPPVCWLSGTAGVGKSAIALTFAEECEDKNELVASFFFFRSDPKRNNPSFLILSIARGLVVTRPHLGSLVNQQIHADPEILKATLEAQYNKLVLRNLNHSSPSPSETGPNLVIIDGLDECSDASTQQRVLSIIFSTFQQPLHSPLRFLICSRPEAWIREAFTSSAYCSLTKHINLDDSFRAWYDIELYFNQQFRAIRSDPKYSQVQFPDAWPSSHVVGLLVYRANGQFIYASTVIKFITTEGTHPIEQLDIILGYISTKSSDPPTSGPFYELDILYRTVLCANRDPNKRLVPILAAIILLPDFIATRSPAFIERVLGFSPGTVTLTLHAMHSVLNVNGRFNVIHIHHRSFADFLTDQTRSKEFFIDEDHCFDFLAQRWLHALQTPKSSVEHDSMLWRYWDLVCCRVDNPTRELLLELDGLRLGALIAGTLKFMSYDGLGTMRTLFHRFKDIADWLHRQPDGTVPPSLLDRFETVLKGFAIPAGKVTVTEIVACHKLASGITVWATNVWSRHGSPEMQSILNYDLPKSVLLDLLSSAEFCPCSSFGDEVDYFQVGTDRYYRVNLQPHYFETMKALANILNDLDDPEKRDIFWYLLHPWLVTLCHPQPKVLSVYRATLIAAERWGQRHLFDTQPPPWLIDNSKRLQRKILSWLDSFPPEYATQVAEVKEIIDDSRIYWSPHGLYIRDEPLDQWLNGF